MTSHFAVLFLILLVRADAFSFPKRQCSFYENDAECQELIQQMTSDPKTKMIYIRIVSKGRMQSRKNAINQNERQNLTVQTENATNQKERQNLTIQKENATNQNERLNLTIQKENATNQNERLNLTIQIENATNQNERLNLTIQYGNENLSEINKEGNHTYHGRNKSIVNETDDQLIFVKNLTIQDKSHTTTIQNDRLNITHQGEGMNTSSSKKENRTIELVDNQYLTNRFKYYLIEYVWVNESSIYLLTYPDDFHSLTFGVLADNIYELEVKISNENERYIFLSFVSNVSDGKVCHRYFQNSLWFYDPFTGLYGFTFDDSSALWIGHDYLCFSTLDKPGNIITKVTSSIILINILCAACILWFPLIFVLMDQNKIQMKGTNTELQYLGEHIKKFYRLSVRKRSAVKRKENNHTDTENEDKTHHLDTYDQGDVPYGIQRLFINCFHGSRSKKVPTIVSYCRFVGLFMLILTILALIIKDHEYQHIPPDLTPYISHNIYGDIVLTSLFYFGIFCFYMNLSLKDYTYSFDIYSLFKKGKFLTYIKFSDILGPLSDSNIFHNMINRLSIVFHIELWIRVVFGPFSQTKFHKWNTLKKIILLVPCLLSICCNIIFQILWAFPMFWYFFIALFFVFQVSYSFLTKLPCLRNKLSKLVMKLLGALIFPFATLYLFAFQFDKMMVISVIASMVKIFCYIFFIALPQMHSSNFRLIFSCVFILSYCVQHYMTLTGLYTELLKMIFKIHEEEKFKADYVRIAEFDYVSAHVFPFRVQFFYFFCKIFLTSVFFFVAVEQVFYLNNDEMHDDMEFDGIISFFFILLSPALAEFALNPSQEKKILSNKMEIRKLVRKWHNIPETTMEVVNHSCNCYIPDFYTLIGESIFGCCFEFTNDNHCRLCSIPIPDEDTNSDITERNVPNMAQETKRHFMTIKFPKYTKEFEQKWFGIRTENKDDVANDIDENEEMKEIITL